MSESLCTQPAPGLWSCSWTGRQWAAFRMRYSPNSAHVTWEDVGIPSWRCFWGMTTSCFDLTWPRIGRRRRTQGWMNSLQRRANTWVDPSGDNRWVVTHGRFPAINHLLSVTQHRSSGLINSHITAALMTKGVPHYFLICTQTVSDGWRTSLLTFAFRTAATDFSFETRRLHHDDITMMTSHWIAGLH